MASPPVPERCHGLFELLGDVGHVRHHGADEKLPGGLLGQVRQVGQGLGHALVADQERGSGKLLVPAGPVRQPRGHLQTARRRVGHAERPQAVGGADQAVGRRPDRAGGQARHPLLDDRRHRPVGHFGLEEGQPFGKPRRHPEGDGPGVFAQRLVGRWRRRVQMLPIGRHPTPRWRRLGRSARAPPRPWAHDSTTRTVRTPGPWRRRRSGRGRARRSAWTSMSVEAGGPKPVPSAGSVPPAHDTPEPGRSHPACRGASSNAHVPASRARHTLRSRRLRRADRCSRGRCAAQSGERG